MRPILCVIDLTQSSVKVLEAAARMAHAYKVHLTILFPYRLIDYAYQGDLAKLKTNLEQEARENFSLFKKQIKLMDQLSYEFQPEIGFSADRITSYVKRNKVDMIIISQRQANAINEVNDMDLQNLIMNSKLPFMIVPEQVDAEIFSNLSI
jgi:predicted P-loop ATPase/GTPase